MQTWRSAIITRGRYSDMRRWRNPGGSETDFQTASYSPAGNYRDVIGLASLIVEQVLAVETERDTPTESVSEIAAEARDSLIISPVRSKLRAPEFAERVRLILNS